MLSVGWQIHFRPSATAGDLFRIPLSVQLQYAPNTAGPQVLGSVSSGAELSLSQLNIPVNVRLLAGVGGGSILAPPTASGERVLRPAFGPTLGASVGLELGGFRTEIRYDYLLNVVENSPNAHTLSLRLGGAF